MRPVAADLARTLGLEPHPEGGWFRETYRAVETVETARGPRALSTAIVFLIAAASPSRFHRLQSDELWVFQGGTPLELVTLDAGGEAHRRVLGHSAATAGALPEALVPAGAWQAARVAPGDVPSSEHVWSLVSCIVTPGFAYEDFELASRAELLRLLPGEAELISELT